MLALGALTITPSCATPRSASPSSTTPVTTTAPPEAELEGGAAPLAPSFDVGSPEAKAAALVAAIASLDVDLSAALTDLATPELRASISQGRRSDGDETASKDCATGIAAVDQVAQSPDEAVEVVWLTGGRGCPSALRSYRVTLVRTPIGWRAAGVTP